MPLKGLASVKVCQVVRPSSSRRYGNAVFSINCARESLLQVFCNHVFCESMRV
jgi:hypothetical protein